MDTKRNTTRTNHVLVTEKESIQKEDGMIHI